MGNKKTGILGFLFGKQTDEEKTYTDLTPGTESKFATDEGNDKGSNPREKTTAPKGTSGYIPPINTGITKENQEPSPSEVFMSLEAKEGTATFYGKSKGQEIPVNISRQLNITAESKKIMDIGAESLQKQINAFGEYALLNPTIPKDITEALAKERKQQTIEKHASAVELAAFEHAANNVEGTSLPTKEQEYNSLENGVNNYTRLIKELLEAESHDDQVNTFKDMQKQRAVLLSYTIMKDPSDKLLLGIKEDLKSSIIISDSGTAEDSLVATLNESAKKHHTEEPVVSEEEQSFIKGMFTEEHSM